MMLTDDVWSSKECAAFLKVTPKHFLRHHRWLETFPKQLAWSEAGHPRWSAESVRAWALRESSAIEA